MANQMVIFSSSMALPKLGQIFTVRSVTWVIGPDGNGRIMEAVQDHPAPIVPTPTTTSPIPAPRRWVRRSISSDDLIASIDRVTDRLAECQLLVDSVLDQSRASDDLPALQDHQAATVERLVRLHRSRWPDFDLVITAAPEGRTARRRPLPATGLRLTDYEAPMENPPRPCPFGLEGVGSAYQNVIQHLFVNHVERDHVSDLYMIDP